MSKTYWVVSPFVLMLLGWVLILIGLPPFALSSTGLFAIIPLYLLWQRVSRRNALQLGGMFGLLISVCFAWGVFAYSRVAFVAVVGVSIGLYALLFAACARHAQRNSLWSPLHVALIWTLVDVVASAIGIPYSFALTLIDLSIIIQPAHLGGEHLVTLLVVYVQAAVASMLFTSSHALHRRRSQPKQALLLLLPLLIIAMSNVTGNYSTVGTMRVSAVQTSFHPYRYVLMAADGVLEQNQYELQAISQQVPTDVDMVIWPELAVRGYLFRQSAALSVSATGLNADSTGRLAQSAILSPGVPAHEKFHLLNVLDIDRRGQKQIRSFLLDGQGDVLRVSGKEHLIPMIERSVDNGKEIYTNTRLQRASIQFGPAAGKAMDANSEMPAAPAVLTVANLPVPLICYESTIPTASARRVGDAPFIAVQTSDAFAGPSLIAELGYRHAILRAVENRRAVVRSANGGISAIIDARGNVQAGLPMFETGVLTETITLYQGVTWFARHWEGWLVFFVILGLISYLLSEPWLVDSPTGRRGGRTNVVRLLIVLMIAGLTMAGHSKALSMQYNRALEKAEENSLPLIRRDFYTPFFANVANLDSFSYAQLSHSDPNESFSYAMAFLLRTYGHDVTGVQVAQRLDLLGEDRLQNRLIETKALAANISAADNLAFDEVQDAETIRAEEVSEDVADLLTRSYGYDLSAISLQSSVLPLPALARMNNGEHIVLEEIGQSEVTFFSPVNGRIRLSRAYFFDRLALQRVLFLAPDDQPWDGL